LPNNTAGIALAIDRWSLDLSNVADLRDKLSVIRGLNLKSAAEKRSGWL